MIFSVAQQSLQGGREYNEDRTAVYQRQKTVFLVLADGLGGHPGGELAAQTLVDAVGKLFFQVRYEQLDAPEQFLQTCVQFAHRVIHQKAIINGYPQHTPKTTAVLVLLHKEQLTYAHSGDSRFYLIQDNRIVVSTIDHTSDGSNDNMLSRCVGGGREPEPDISNTKKMRDKDIIVLASDGGWESLRASDLKDFIDPCYPTLGLDNLLYMLESRNKSPSDNLSLVVLFYGVLQKDTPTILTSL